MPQSCRPVTIPPRVSAYTPIQKQKTDSWGAYEKILPSSDFIQNHLFGNIKLTKMIQNMMNISRTEVKTKPRHSETKPNHLF